MERGEHKALGDELTRMAQRTCATYDLLAPGDRVLVAVSGGKDSATMLDVLRTLQRRLPIAFELVAVHLDQRQPGYDGSTLVAWLETLDVPFEVLSEDTYAEVVARTAPGATYCAVCSRLRRGILYSAAERLGCNKVALGHHRDDALETFLMNLFYEGRLQAMPARYTTDDGRFEVIRPLIECGEDRIARYAALSRFPILPCNLCGSQESLQRDRMASLIASLEATHPHVRRVMAHALRNVRPTHLLDPALLALVANEPHRPTAPEAPKRYAAEPVITGARRLPVLRGDGS